MTAEAVHPAGVDALPGEAGALAPIALFVHARLDHLRRTIDALRLNDGASESDLFVFSDGPRPHREGEAEAVSAVREYVASIEGFRSVTVIAQEGNVGLARNITQGVTQLMQRYGRAIVLEDDIVTSPPFLSFMNEALRRYREDPTVWHVNGWAYPMFDSVDAPFFTPIMECWGWASWADRWAHFNADPERAPAFWDRDAIRRFNIDGGYDSWGDIQRNALGVMRTWAVFWYATIFERHGLCLSPGKSYVANIGIDGSGTNSGSRDVLGSETLASALPRRWPEQVECDTTAWNRTAAFLRRNRGPLWRRAAKQLKWRLIAMRARIRQDRREGEARPS